VREQRLLEGWRDKGDEGSVADISSRILKPGLEGKDRLSFSFTFFLLLAVNDLCGSCAYQLSFVCPILFEKLL
jgi:hypothetical protein